MFIFVTDFYVKQLIQTAISFSCGKYILTAMQLLIKRKLLYSEKYFGYLHLVNTEKERSHAESKKIRFYM